MTFADDLRRFTVKVQSTVPAVVVNLAHAIKDSIAEGSAVTGSPGQPVDTGFLRASWQVEVSPGARSAIVGTNVAYAPVIEYGMREAYDRSGVARPKAPEGASRRAIKSTVGGHGSVRATVAAADRLQAVVVAELAR